MNKSIPFIAIGVIALNSFFASSCGPASSGAGLPSEQAGVSRVKIKNGFYFDMAVKLEGPENRVVKIPPRSTQVLTLKPGVYQYAVTAEGANIVGGYKVFEAKRRHNMFFNPSLQRSSRRNRSRSGRYGGSGRSGRY